MTVHDAIPKERGLSVSYRYLTTLGFCERRDRGILHLMNLADDRGDAAIA